MKIWQASQLAASVLSRIREAKRSDHVVTWGEAWDIIDETVRDAMSSFGLGGRVLFRENEED